MSLKPKLTPSAKCLDSVSVAVEYLGNVIKLNWPVAYPNQPAPAQVSPPLGEPLPPIPPVLDLEAAQAFFDGITAIIPEGAADLCVINSFASALVNYAKAVDQGVMDTATRVAFLGTLPNLRTLHTAIDALPITDPAPALPPCDLAVNQDFSVTVSPLPQ